MASATSASSGPRPCRSSVIAVDAIFTPVRKVNYWVESTRVGQVTNFDKLTIEIETDGTIGPEEALSRAASILIEQFRPFVTIGRPRWPPIAACPASQLPPNMLDMPIEELDLPMRAYNSLKRNNIVKVGQLLQLKDEDLLRMRNFGKKSLDEMKERLRMRGFILPRRSRRTSTRRGRGRVAVRGRGRLIMAHRSMAASSAGRWAPASRCTRTSRSRCCATSA